jgi:hypothetical protein
MTKPRRLSDVVTIVTFVTDSSPTALTWVSEYDYPNRRVSLSLADAGVFGHHWTGIREDPSLSDPGGDFDVFVAHRPEPVGNPGEESPNAKVVAALNDAGDIKTPHPDFNTFAIGSPTIWPYKVAGERFGLSHWVWWMSDEVFARTPRSWAEAANDG